MAGPDTYALLPLSEGHTQETAAAILSSDEDSHVNPDNLSMTESPPASDVRQKVAQRWGRREWNPLAYVVVQLVMLGFASVWYIVGIYRPILLPKTAAEFVKQSPQLTAFMITGISIVLSKVMSFTFSQIVILLLTQTLEHPTSLFALAAVLQAARGNFVIRYERIKWSLATLGTGLLIATLTASFSALLTPKIVLVTRPITGVELDVFSPAFEDLGYNWASGTTQEARQSALDAIIDTTAALAAGSPFGYLGIVNLNGAAWNVSTGGAMANGPLGHGIASSDNETEIQPDIFSINGEIHQNYVIKKQFVPPRGFESNYTLDQQGMSADVSCRQQNLTKPNWPFVDGVQGTISLPRNISFSFLDDIFNTSTLHDWRWTMGCPIHNSSAVEIDNLMVDTSGTYLEGNQIVGGICPWQDLQGQPSYSTHSLLLVSSGTASKWFNSTACTLTMKATKIRVDYNSVINYVQELESHPYMTEGFSLLPYFIYINLKTQINNQNLAFSVFGERISSVYFGRPESVSGDEDQKQAILHAILENYIRGVVEMTATTLRNSESLKGALPEDVIPPDMLTTFNGTWRAETMGWDNSSNGHRSPYTAFVTLFPIITVALLSIALLVVYWARGRSAGFVMEQIEGDPVQFDPTNTAHLLVATVRGNSTVALLQDGDTIDHVEGIRVQLRDDNIRRRLHLVRED